MALSAQQIGRPWRVERSERDQNRVIVRRADGVWICDFEGETAMAFAEVVATAVNAPEPEKIVAEFEDIFGKIKATERRWLVRRFSGQEA